MTRMMFAAGAALALTLTAAGAAGAYEMDAAGVGIVGKGEVQTAFGWNNKQLQDNAGSVSFSYVSSSVSEVSWTCSKVTQVNEQHEQTQERRRTTMTTTSGVVDSVVRTRNQVTGFNLAGLADGAVQSTETDGPPLNSCPSFWELTPAGEPVILEGSTGGLYAQFGEQRVLLP